MVSHHGEFAASIFHGTQGDAGRAPASTGLIAEPKGDDFRKALEQAVHTLAQGAGAFSVDDANLEQTALAAFPKVFREEIADLIRAKGVEVQLRGDGDGDGLRFVVAHAGNFGGGKVFREIGHQDAVKRKRDQPRMNRDTEEFIELLTGAQTAVFGYIMSLCHDYAKAQDILQEANLTLWRKAEDFEPGTNFNAWACRVAYFHVLNHRRKQQREKLVFDDSLFDYLSERQEQRAESADVRLTALRRCLTKLPDKQRQLIERRYHPGASVQGIASDDGKSEGAISQALFRIRASLQHCVEQTLAKGGTA